MTLEVYSALGALPPQNFPVPGHTHHSGVLVALAELSS